MPTPNRRSFLLGAAALIAGGCMSGYYRGAAETTVFDPLAPGPPAAQEKARPPAQPRLNTPIYAGEDCDWVPNLAPIPRAVWATGAPIDERLSPMGTVKRITVHHEGSATPNESRTLEEVARDLREIRKFHVQNMAAGDIGYHFIIDREGRIWEGRPARFRGAHAGGEENAHNLGVMLLGNFDVQTPTNRQLRALEMFLRLQMARYRLGLRAVFTHQELKATRCPGKHLQAHMLRFRACFDRS